MDTEEAAAACDRFANLSNCVNGSSWPCNESVSDSMPEAEPTVGLALLTLFFFLLGFAATARPRQRRADAGHAASHSQSSQVYVQPAGQGSPVDAAPLQALRHDVPELTAFDGKWRQVVNVDNGRARVLRSLDDRGDFTLRVVSQLECGVDELLSLVVELDLMPSWNRFCRGAAIFHRVSPTDLYAGGAARLPWVLPRYLILLRAQLLDLMATPRQCMLVVARTPKDGDFRNEDPPHAAALLDCMQGGRVLPLQLAICALTPAASPAGTARLSFDLVVSVQLSLTYVPQSLIDFVMRMMVPWLCRRVLALVHDIATQPESEFRHRMRADATGVYRIMREATSPAVTKLGLRGAGSESKPSKMEESCT